MASAINKLAKLEEALTEARREAATEAADILMQTGAYTLGSTKLRKLLVAAVAASEQQWERGLEAFKAKGMSAENERDKPIAAE